MVSIYFLRGAIYWIIPYILQVIGYNFLLKKMGLVRWTCIIPFLAERQFTKVMFRKMRSFYRPFVIALIFVLAACYLDPSEGMGRSFILVAFAVYGFFLLRLYWRIAKAMGKGKLFRIFTLIAPPLFLLIMGVGKSEYHPLPLKPLKEYSRPVSIFRRAVLVVVSAVEIVVIVVGVGYFAVKDTPPAPLVGFIIEDTYNKTKNITGTGDVVSREETMGKAAATIGNIQTDREHFFPSHKDDKSVVVMTYVIGSNLEDKSGYASVNIRQMIDATKAGSGLTFVMEAGGSKRWFSDEIEDNSYGRYTIKDGKIGRVGILSPDLCMSEEKSLADFISWTRDNYPADRYMLVLWDHGGGVPYGYGQDELNDRKADITGCNTMLVSEVVSAIKQSGVKFDIIGFDACLMQDIEISSALEPYADYYLASEENEGGYGWFYTSAFGQLASDPGMPSEEFGKTMIACYDPYNTIIKDEDGKPDTMATLSFVDLTLSKTAYRKLDSLFRKAGDAIKEDPGSYATVAVAAGNAYAFCDDCQIDLIDFLQIMDKNDFEESICSHKEKMDLINTIRASVIYRNGDSAKGINGVSLALPYKAIDYYGRTSDELKSLSMKSEKKTFDEIFSIIAAQQKKSMDEIDKKDDHSFQDFLEMVDYTDYTEESWYIKGFEDYDDTKTLVDIPLKELADGYQIEIPKKQWPLIADCQTMAYQKVKSKSKGEVLRYIGSDQIGGDDPNGHPMISMDDNWVHIDGALVCYEAAPVRETDEGEVFTGTVKARLNGEDKITLNIEWDPVKEGDEAPATGHVTGYDTESVWDIIGGKGEEKLEAGDVIEFMFDYYDSEGNLIKTKPYGKKLYVSKQNRLQVKDEPLESCDIQFGGVLTDVYQRTITTEQLEMHID